MLPLHFMIKSKANFLIIVRLISIVRDISEDLYSQLTELLNEQTVTHGGKCASGEEFKMHWRFFMFT
jgi:hypothetical protein